MAEWNPAMSHIHYHDYEYVFPIHDDDKLVATVLEINQAGLSWLTILKKKDNFFAAFDIIFSIEKVARYTDKKVARLLQDPGIIRNRLKINAAIENARRIIQIAEGVRFFSAMAANTIIR